MNYYNRYPKSVVIMRGWPGSGKSTLARELCRNWAGWYCHPVNPQFPQPSQYGMSTYKVVSADNYHINPATGVYEWKQENQAAAHANCKANFVAAVKAGFSLIIVDNTNIKRHDYQFYIDACRGTEYRVCQARPDTYWRDDVGLCTEYCVHGVPEATIRRMKEQFEDDPELEHFSIEPQREVTYIPDQGDTGEVVRGGSWLTRLFLGG